MTNTELENGISRKWQTMMRKCYKGIDTDYSVIEEWHYFENFRLWALDKYCKGDQLDIHIRTSDKVYSPDTCCFINQELHNLLPIKSKGKYPLGVSKIGKQYFATIRLDKQNTKLGVFDTVKEASAEYNQMLILKIKHAANKQTDPDIRKGLLKHASIINRMGDEIRI